MRIRGFRSTVATSRGVSVQIAGDRMKGECTEMSRISRRHFLATGAAASLARSAQTAGDRPAPPDFVNPPWEARPSTYWVWLNGFTDPRRITYELEELHKAGFNAAYILEIGARAGEGVPAGPAYFGPESLKAIGHAVREAGRLGLDIGVTNSSSWNSGGSWITPEHAAKGLYWTRIPVRGPARFSEVLPFPQLPGAVPRKPDRSPAYYSDVAVLAAPDDRRVPGFDFVIDLAPGVHTIERLALHNVDADTAVKDVAVYASDTGIEEADFREIFRGTLERRAGPQSFPCTRAQAKYVKLRIISGHNPARVSLAEFEGFNPAGQNVITVMLPNGRKPVGGLLRFTTQAGLEREWMAENIYDGRLAGARGSWAAEGPLPPLVASRSAIVDVSDHFRDGRLTWDVPAGNWSLYRFLCANNGEKLVAPSPHSDGFIIDHYSAAATRFHTEYMLERLGEELGDLRKSALKYFYACSYEVRGSIWTPTFLEDFRRLRGYDALPFLPVLAGVTVESDDISDRFRIDFRRTISDLFTGNFYGTTRQLSERSGLKLICEAGGPGWPLHQVPADALKAQSEVSIPRGEFWKGHPVCVVKETASAAHVYGGRIVQMESFTSFRHWQDGPRDLKDIADQALCDGCNQFVWHTMPHVPEAAGKPGPVYHAGTHNGPNETWWPLARPFFDYLARCSWLLRQGLFVADLCYYYGDRGYNFGPEKYEMAGLGLPAGYDFDTVNSDVIANRLSVKDGRLVLPDGMSYAALVMVDRPEIAPEVLEKIEQLVRDGATVHGPKPRHAAGLTNYPACDARVRDIAERVWGDCDGVRVLEHAYGKGKVYWGIPVAGILRRRNLSPDFSSTAEMDYIHRRTGERDIYFVRNKREEDVEADCTFRVAGRGAELWDAVTGAVRPLAVSPTAEGSRVKIRLPAVGSAFVIFDPAFRRDVRPPALNKAPAPVAIAGPWEVRFAPGWGARESASFEALRSWTEHDDPGIRYFSGVATYLKSITLSASQTRSRVFLDLGDVRVIARAKVNGKEAGGCWTPPFRVEVTGLLKPGANLLEIEVANMWSNRLTGDAIASGQKYTHTNIPWPKDTPLLPAGLLGPVRLVWPA